MDKKLLVGVLAIVVIVIFGVFYFGQFTPSGAFIAEPKKDLVVGASLSLTGKAASYGVGMKNGIELALDKIKSEGKSVKLRVLFDDTSSTPEKAVTSAQKFLEVDGAKAIVTVGADETLAVVPVTEAKEAILFTPIGGSDKIDGAGKYVFRNREPSKLTAYSLAEFISKKGLNKVALFVAKSSSSPISYEKSFLEKANQIGLAFESFYYDEASVDVRTSIARAKENGDVAAYVIASKDKDGAEVIRQLAEMGFDGLIVGGPALDTSKFFEASQGSAEGVIIAVASVDSSAPNASKVLSDYKQKYNSEMTFFAANAYDMVMLLNSAAGKCGEDTDCIREYLLSVKDYPGLGGKTTFNPNGGVTKPLGYKIASDGKFVQYEAS
jgi:branched-chain amino acid transport system substrate-binding protein